MPRDVGVVIVAAGQGSRLRGAVLKQYRDLGGVPLLLRALQPFAAHPEVAHVVIVLPAAEAGRPPSWLGDLVGPGLSIVPGGAERSDSVALGLAALPGGCGTVLVHDGARPFADRETIDAVITVARHGDGAVPAVPLAETLKETGESPPAAGGAGAVESLPVVVRTVPRDRLWLAQTPQGFPRALLEEAHARARRDGVAPTDDAMLVERLGGRVRLVPGSRRNLKVTTEDDLRLAEQLL